MREAQEMQKKVVIIGAGIAGLSAGCYLQMNGYDTEIFELHNVPGGVCTSWRRRGYTFDGCVHWLAGTKEGSGLNRVWRELGALPSPIVNFDEFRRIEGAGGRELVLYLDPDRLEEHLKQLSSIDSGPIELLTGSLRKLRGVTLPLWPPKDRTEVLELVKMLPVFVRLLLVAFKTRKLTIGKFINRFKDPFLRDAFGQLALLVKPGSSVSEDPAYSLLGVLMALAANAGQAAGYPVGGSLAFARRIENRYLELGGKICYRSRVTEITTNEGRATGVRLEDGTEHAGDIIISAADGRSTIFDMLGGAYVTEDIRRRYDNWSLYPPLVQVSIGVALDLSSEHHLVQFSLERPLDTGGRNQESLIYTVYSFDPTLAPEGKSIVITQLTSDYDYWERLGADSEAYAAEKKRIADDIIDILDARLTGLRDAVEAVDVATPLTYVRYTANWRGSYEGWLPEEQNMRYMMTGMKNTLPGLENFYMIGQWVQPGGGLPTSALHGRRIARTICRKDGRKFTTTQP